MTDRPTAAEAAAGATTPPGAELALLLDVGSAWAKGSLVGRARDRWRVVAHIAQPTSWGTDALESSLAAQLAPNADARLAGRMRELVAGATRIECHTPNRPARMAIVAVSRDLSGAAARRAAESAGWEASVLATADDGRPLGERLAALESAAPDAWLLAGGFDDARSPQALEMAALVAAARRDGDGRVIWAGSERLAGEVAALFPDGAVERLPNPRPSAAHEESAALRGYLESLLRTVVEPGAQLHVAPVAFRRAVAKLARLTGLRVAGVDIGASYATRVMAVPDGSVEARVFAGGGLRGAAAGTGPARVARLMAAAVDEPAVADVLGNMRSRPATLPNSEEDLAVTQAAARAQLASMVDDEPLGGVDLIVGAGQAVAAAPTAAAATQMLLDGLRPLGVAQLALDRAALLGPLGALGDDEIAEGISLLADDLLVPLGTAVVCAGGEPGRAAMRVTIHRAGWPEPPPIEVRTGQLIIEPLPRGAEAELTIEPADGVSLGAPRRAARLRARATGGASGLVLDARGVPLALPRRADDRRAVLAGWRDALAREPAAELDRRL